MSSAKILYAEDDPTLAFLTIDSLEEAGYQVTHCPDGHACLDAFRKHKFDLCILDIMMPKADGFETAAEIRKLDADIPLLFLSAKTLKEDRLRGLRLGADDYLVKPFSMEELLLKIEVFLRRTKKTETVQATIEVGKYRFDPANFYLSQGTDRHQLTQRESDLLHYFCRHQNTIIRREDILKAIWGDDDYFMGRSLDVFISRLRKLFPKGEGPWIENIHGIGFRFVTETAS